MSGTSWGRVLGAVNRANWTNRWTRGVLVVVHTVTAMNRFADILDVFDSDRRVQLFCTFPDAAQVPADIERALTETGALTITWREATTRQFDLAISAHHSGNLQDIDAPLVLLSHGMGYTKQGKRENGKTGKRESREVYGLGPDWILRDGEVFADAIVLSHREQLDRLAQATPAALDRAVVAGDPCFDRLITSAARRRDYRRALGVDEETVVVVSSTWGENSLFGRHPDLLSELVGELTLDHAVAAVLHPNVWFAHGPGQVRRWLGDALRSGLRLVPPFRGWQQAILAADAVIGDHGAVTGYAAAIGVPTLLATFPDEEIARGSAIETLGEKAPVLDQDRPFEEQIHDAIEYHHAGSGSDVAELTSSMPGKAADLLRALFYRLMELPEPAHPPLLVPYPTDELRPEHQAVAATWIATEWLDDQVVQLHGWPADVTARRGRGPRATEAHLVVHADHPRRDLRGNASIVVCPPDRDLASALRQRAACQLAVTVDPDGTYRILHRDGDQLTVAARSPDPAIVASAVHSWTVHKGHWGALPTELTIKTGTRAIPVTINRATA